MRKLILVVLLAVVLSGCVPGIFIYRNVKVDTEQSTATAWGIGLGIPSEDHFIKAR